MKNQCDAIQCDSQFEVSKPTNSHGFYNEISCNSCEAMLFNNQFEHKSEESQKPLKKGEQIQYSWIYEEEKVEVLQSKSYVINVDCIFARVRCMKQRERERNLFAWILCCWNMFYNPFHMYIYISAVLCLYLTFLHFRQERQLFYSFVVFLILRSALTCTHCNSIIFIIPLCVRKSTKKQKKNEKKQNKRTVSKTHKHKKHITCTAFPTLNLLNARILNTFSREFNDSGETISRNRYHMQKSNFCIHTHTHTHIRTEYLISCARKVNNKNNHDLVNVWREIQHAYTHTHT